MSTYVCLVTEEELKRQGKPYIEIVKNLLTQQPKEYPSVSISKLQYIHVPIRGTNYKVVNSYGCPSDKQTISDESLIKLLDDLMKRFIAGEKMFIHCKGGHGRTGKV